MISWIFPANYRASATIYVALNPYRTYEDSNFLANVKPEYSNLDDYKNWQMGQLNTVVFLDEIVQETLDRLKEKDQTWEPIEAKQLREQFITEWRSAGKWSLVAENRDEELSAQAAETWGEVVVERVGAAVDSARDLISIDYELEAAAENLNVARHQLQQLENTHDQLEGWLLNVQEFPAEEPIDVAERWRILGLVTDLAQFEPGWIELLKNQPEESASRDVTMNWIGQVLNKIEAETSILEESIEQLEQEQADLEEQYAAQFDLSRGLSPNMEIERIESVPAERVQPHALMTLVGGVCGLLLWVFKELVRITNQVKRNEQAKLDPAIK
jgi:hypothetical protein